MTLFQVILFFYQQKRLSLTNQTHGRIDGFERCAKVELFT